MVFARWKRVSTSTLDHLRSGCERLTHSRGDDDFFSSDLSDAEVEAVWSRFKQPVLILPSGEDEHVPKFIDVPGQLEKWKGHCAPGIASELSGLIPGATHNVKQADSQEWLAHKVASFLESLEK